MNDTGPVASVAAEVPRILLHQDGRILVATLNRPAEYNGIDAAMAEALVQLADRVSGDPGIDALVLTGSGRAFCAGGDTAMFKESMGRSDFAEVLDAMATRVHGALVKLVDAGPLLIAAVNGPATGAGLGLLCACDFAFGRPSATLRPGFARFGLSPDTGTTYFLPRIIGYRSAMQFLLGGVPMTAEAAQRAGIYTAVLEGDEPGFIRQVLEFIRPMIAVGATSRATRRLLREGESAPMAAHLRREQASLVALAADPDVIAHQKRLELG